MDQKQFFRKCGQQIRDFFSADTRLPDFVRPLLKLLIAAKNDVASKEAYSSVIAWINTQPTPTDYALIASVPHQQQEQFRQLPLLTELSLLFSF